MHSRRDLRHDRILAVFCPTGQRHGRLKPSPGRITSEQIRRNYAPDYRARFAEEEIPVSYWGEEDLAAPVVFLASPVARYIAGTVIPVDGGPRLYQL